MSVGMENTGEVELPCLSSESPMSQGQPMLSDLRSPTHQLPPYMTVRCRKASGTLHLEKLGNGSSGKCILIDDKFVTPVQFEILSGLKGGDWKRSIYYDGHHLSAVFARHKIRAHAKRCKCKNCTDGTLNDPVTYAIPVLNRRRRMMDMFNGYYDMFGNYPSTYVQNQVNSVVQSSTSPIPQINPGQCLPASPGQSNQNSQQQALTHVLNCIVASNNTPRNSSYTAYNQHIQAQHYEKSVKEILATVTALEHRIESTERAITDMKNIVGYLKNGISSLYLQSSKNYSYRTPYNSSSYTNGGHVPSGDQRHSGNDRDVEVQENKGDPPDYEPVVKAARLAETLQKFATEHSTTQPTTITKPSDNDTSDQPTTLLSTALENPESIDPPTSTSSNTSPTISQQNLPNTSLPIAAKAEPRSTSIEKSDLPKDVQEPINDNDFVLTLDEEEEESDYEADRIKCQMCVNQAQHECSRCTSVFYCSMNCQILHWNAGHREACGQTPR